MKENIENNRLNPCCNGRYSQRAKWKLLGKSIEES